MSHTTTHHNEWHVSYYLGEETDYYLSSPVAGMTYHIKVFVPLSQLRHYTRTEYRDGRAVWLLKDHNSYVKCAIHEYSVDTSTGQRVGSWVPLTQARAEWDGAPASGGYFTFLSASSVAGVYHGAKYSHSLKFVEGSDKASNPQITAQTNSFRIEY
ncbi:hypothetical protein F5Y14DRAFT_456979 [Nemania sp. NC0429]|nr:hypothetical protein F5Y14DRAFT_456979 [Nemania sp. NC0429]